MTIEKNRAEKGCAYPLTPSELGMYIEHKMNPESYAYNINRAFEFTGDFDIEKWKRTFGKLVDLHENLRAYYIEEKGVPKRCVLPVLVPEFSFFEVERANVKAHIEKRQRPFDLSVAPLFELCFYKTETSVIFHLMIHHIIYDFGTETIFLEELKKLYSGEAVKGEDEGLNHFSCILEENPDTAFTTSAKAFFDTQFKEGIPENDMPTKGKRPDELPDGDTVARAYLDEKTTFDIGALAKKAGVSPYVVMLSAWALVISKYCDTEDLVVGVPHSGRRLKEAKTTGGMFVNTLPVRLKPVQKLTVIDYLKKTAETTRAFKKFQDYPLSQILKDLEVEHDPSRNPLYDVMFNLLAEGEAYKTENMTMKPFALPKQLIAIDLCMTAERIKTGFRIEIDYSKQLYDPVVVNNMMEQYLWVIKRMITAPECRLYEAAALPEDQLKVLTEDFGGERLTLPQNETIVSLFREQARRYPENPAVKFMGEQLSYKALNAQSDRLAQALKHLGIGASQVVGILIDRGPGMVIYPLSVLKTGAAYLPMIPSYPKERIEFMLEDSGASLLIVDDAYKDLAENFTGKIILSSQLKSLEAPAMALTDPSPEDHLLLLYTSGSTGTPKGCVFEHRNLVNYALWHCHEFEIDHNTTVSAYASFAFDASLMDLFAVLTCGGATCIVPEDMRLDLPAVNRYYEANDVNVAFFTTQLGRQFAMGMKNDKLRCLITGGETLVPPDKLPAYRLVNAYGPTETLVIIATFTIDGIYENVPIGSPTGNIRIYIMDKNGGLAPVGVAGELCIAGVQVGLGYLNRPELTAEKFIKNPFSDDPDFSRMYKSGDICRYLPDGNLEFVGRRDFQVKIRGYRIELTEIEARIRCYEAIKDATVVALDDPAGGKFVAAYVVADEPLDLKALEDFIGKELPSYMIPAAITVVDAIPLNANGKVDKRKLPAPEFNMEVEAEEAEPTERKLTVFEEKLRDIAEHILGHANFGITSNLMKAGLTSLSAIQMIMEISDAFHIDLPVKILLSGGSILSVENALLEALLSGRLEPSAAVETAPKALKEAYPLTESQWGVYYDAVKHPDTIMYNIPVQIRLAKDIDALRLQKAAASVLTAHPILGTHLKKDETGLVQVYRETAPETITVKEMTEEGLSRYRLAFVKPFDLFEGPLYRMEIVKTEAALYLLFDVHHLVFDGGSLDIFMTQLDESYGGTAPIKEQCTYYHYAEIEKEQAESAAYKEARAYFDQSLLDFESASKISPDRSEKESTGQLKEVVRGISAQKLEAFCADQGITPAQLFFAASAYAVSRHTASREVFLATISSGRSDLKLRDTFGMFVKTLPLSLKIDPQKTVLELLQTAQENLINTTANEIYPFTKLAADYGYAPDIMYACELGVLKDFNLDGQPATLLPLGLEVPKFKISIHIEEREGQPAVCVQYNDALYTEDLMTVFAQSIARTAEAMMAEPQTKAGGISMLSEEQKSQIKGFEKTAEAPLLEERLHVLFENQAAAKKDHVALIAVDRTYSYKELNQAANRIAAGLIKSGVKQGDRVAFVLPRTSRVILSELGILKAGAAFIPCDPEYPMERIEQILEDSDAAYVIAPMGFTVKTPGVQVLYLEALLKEEITGNPEIPVTGDDLAYLIYTSGSTGKPKGVMLCHRGIANYVTPHQENRHMHALLEDAHTMLSVTTVSFDMSLKEIMGALCNGLTLVLASEDQANNPAQLADLFKETSADAFNTTPSRMLQYLEYEALEEALSNCRVIMAGAEKYPEALLKKLGSFKQVRLFNTYGPTEITVSSNAMEVQPDKPVTIGRPLLNVYEYIVDADNNLLPPLTVGELLVGGAGVAKGYQKRPEMDAESFIDFSGHRVYRTGDYARWTKEGEVVILGRKDNQVKLRGLRIELGEIEKAIGDDPEITSVAVVIRKIGAGDHICAYFTAKQSIDTEALKAQLKNILPQYMIPTAYKQLEKMPMTQNGKMNLKALPEPEMAEMGNYTPPSTETEAYFCTLFERILEREKVGINDNFFELGGTSLVVSSIIIEATKAQFEITYGDVFSRPTPKQLAAMFEHETKAEEKNPLDDLADYDYHTLMPVLEQNTLEAFRNEEKVAIGNILLTGATGFLGIHFLREFLKKEEGIAYCLMRKGKFASTKERLISMLVYYFDQDFEDEFDKRIIIREGDVTHYKDFEQLKDEPIDTVFNCAANVKHFSKGTDIEDVNVGGVLNCIRFCEEKNSRLVHISTTSVGGFSIDGALSGKVLTEQALYFGQALDTKYGHSKFEAERAVLEHIKTGLSAKIMRVGNLSARDSDGEFQINFASNSFVGRLKAYKMIGSFPYNMMSSKSELAPIDSTAEAILQLSKTPKSCCIFHPYNNHTVFMGDIITAMQDKGLKVELSEHEDFERALELAGKDPEKAKVLSSMVAYQNMGHGREVTPVPVDNEYTMQVLYRMNYRWPMTSKDYMVRFLEALDGLGFFS